jgi:hypothetical protein
MTTDRDGPRSNPYHPDPEKCCEACVFGSGQHAVWCPARSHSGESAERRRQCLLRHGWRFGDTSDVKHAS